MVVVELLTVTPSVACNNRSTYGVSCKENEILEPTPRLATDHSNLPFFHFFYFSLPSFPSSAVSALSALCKNTEGLEMTWPKSVTITVFSS